MSNTVTTLAIISALTFMAACTTPSSAGNTEASSEPAQPLAVPPPATIQPTSATRLIDADSRAAIFTLVSTHPNMDAFAHRAKGVLIFPNVTRAGFLAGVSHGAGELIEGGKVTGYYATTSVSYGFQAGVQQYAYAMLFMTDAALDNFKASKDFEVGVGPTVVVMDEGMAKNLNTETVKSEVYATIFDQRGLMVGSSLRGTKISKVSR
ncbi:lipid-binding SYLF domain-containing protein [Paraburkholderia sp. LEh10]|uniref:lipid-binding SYLF domain-containing protein n=1 Tax=Paraburkholderia sp. LEh10 TaxID=2821353 RepID=UPI001AE8BD65|nr:lipid-binding SYLF domain-containing protein [Paraburkholderia sp. LEh10]MBP0590768.1 lipid-binding SYLF domain-containing protein [Paraburkholderia sp. LEh10]